MTDFDDCIATARAKPKSGRRKGQLIDELLEQCEPAAATKIESALRSRLPHTVVRDAIGLYVKDRPELESFKTVSYETVQRWRQREDITCDLR